jgi:hypothetical protein
MIYLPLHTKLMKEYMTVQGTYHLDAPLAITQHNDAKIHGYAKGSSF